MSTATTTKKAAPKKRAPKPAPPKAVFVRPTQLATALRNISRFACKDSSLPAINTVLVEHKAGQLTVVATDRFTLGVETFNVTAIPSEFGPDFTVMIPLHEVGVLLAALKGQGLSVPVKPVTGGKVTVDNVTVGLVTDYPYPDWRKLISESTKRESTASEVLISPDRLKPFVGLYPGMQIRVTDPNRPLVAVVPGRFIGILMPLRSESDGVAQTLTALGLAA